jgi:large subunit ribosomal protein L22
MARIKPKKEKIKQAKEQYVSIGTARYVRVAPRKARLVADLIRGKNVIEARTILEYANRPSAAPHVLKLLDSVLAEAEREHHGEIEDLVVAKIFVDGGPSMKRIQPRAMGRAFRIIKRTSHITIGLKEIA